MVLKQRKKQVKVEEEEEVVIEGDVKEEPAKAAGNEDAEFGRKVVPLVLFVVLLGVYLGNGDFLPGNDAVANVVLPLQVLATGRPVFGPQSHPYMFTWRLDGKPVFVWRMDKEVGESKTSGMALARAGRLQVVAPRYFVLRSEQGNGQEFVNTFGLGAGLTALPAMAMVWAGHGFDAEAVHGNRVLLAQLSKTVASVCVALSVVFVYLTLMEEDGMGWKVAGAAALVYGVGTGVWPLASQALWQHGPNEMYLAMGMYWMQRSRGGHVGPAVGASFALSMAVVTRPTSAVVAVLFTGVMAMRREWRAFAAYCVPAAVLGACQLAYNAHYLGGTLRFGQTVAAEQLVGGKSSTGEVWGTPLGLGLATLLVSPARGLVVYSPWVVWVAAASSQVEWKRTGALVWACVGSVGVLWVAAAKFFDYYGGWCFGPRPLVDTMPLVAVIGGVVGRAVVDGKSKRKMVWLGSFVLLVAVSVYVQWVGAYAYNGVSWNAAAGWESRLENGMRYSSRTRAMAAQWARLNGGSTPQKVMMNIDREHNRWRLWDWGTSPIVMYAQQFEQGRALKRKLMERWLSGQM